MPACTSICCCEVIWAWQYEQVVPFGRRKCVGPEGVDHALIVLLHVGRNAGFDFRDAGQRRLQFLGEASNPFLVLFLKIGEIGLRRGGRLILLGQLGGPLIDLAEGIENLILE